MRKGYYYQNDPQDNSDFNDYSDEFEPIWKQFLLFLLFCICFMVLFILFIVGIDLDIEIVKTIGPVGLLTLFIFVFSTRLYFRFKLCCPKCNQKFAKFRYFNYTGYLLFHRNCFNCGAILKKKGINLKFNPWIFFGLVLFFLILGILAIYRNIKINNPWLFS